MDKYVEMERMNCTVYAETEINQTLGNISLL